MSDNKDWWKSAVFYQIYPRSFKDSNGDGIGDLPGITQMMPYLRDLGIDAIWISPFFQSPMKDFGYDVSDYKAVDPMFGCMEDFDALLRSAHNHDIKVMIDQVLSHTSDRHEWFQASRQNTTNSKADWYVWEEPKDDGSPPNNWQSVFGGSAWSFDVMRGQYYLHNFLKEQPDLNFHNLDVQDAILDSCRYWLDKGIDGMRLDVVNFYVHSQGLENNPSKISDPNAGEASGTQLEAKDPYSMQSHIYDKSRPENLDFIRRLRALADEYGSTVLLGEIGDDHPFLRSAEYTSAPDLLHTAYNTHLLRGERNVLNQEMIRDPIEKELEFSKGKSWPSWAFSNHDVVRVFSRWGQDKYDNNPDFKKMVLALLLTLRGTIFMYQGDELGLTEASIPYEDLQDPWGIHLWPVWQGRDGCRTPMPWRKDSPHAGFSHTDHKSWLPIPESHYNRAADVQQNDPDSIYNFTKEFLSFRKQHGPLQLGDIKFEESPETTVVFWRSLPNSDEKYLCMYNLDKKSVSLRLPKGLTDCVKNAHVDVNFDSHSIELNSFGWAIIK